MSEDAEAGRNLRPQLTLPREAVPVPLALGLLGVVAVGLFLTLNGKRTTPPAQPGAASYANTGAPMVAPAPPLVVPAMAPAVAASVVPAPAAQAVAPYARMGMMPRPAPRFADGNGVMPNGLMPNGLMHSQPPSLPADLGFIPPQRAPQPAGNGGAALVIDLTAGNGAAASEGATANATSPEDAVRATLIRNRASVIPQGAILAAVLETPLNSDRPGLARAVVTADVRGFDGTRLLIPRGSRLIGEFKAENTPGLRRVLVLWTRLIRPDGVAIRIGSPVTDAMGGAGVAGSVNTHFAEKLASAVLQSALTIGTNVASTLPQSGNSAIYLGLPGQASQLGQQLVPSANRAATVKVREGTQIAVLVARDLDFSGTPVVR